MTNNKHFCTCNEINCKLHPYNHGLGCDPCIKKNLQKGEIPGCFFHLVDDDTSGLNEFTIDSFVAFYLQHQENR